MKKVTYPIAGEMTYTSTYDETLPCIVCGNPVINASMGGPRVCPSCDIGRSRDGKKTGMDFILWVTRATWSVPTFQEVELIASLMEARGIHVREYDCAKLIELGRE